MEPWWVGQVLHWIMGYPEAQIERYMVSPEDPNSLAAARLNVAADTLHPDLGDDLTRENAKARYKAHIDGLRMKKPGAIAELRSALVAGKIVAETAEGPVPARHWKFYAVDGDLRVRFDPDAVQAYWPRPRPSVDDFLHRAIGEARETGGKLDRGDREPGFVTDCVEQTGCTRKEARDAWKRVPIELRRKPGQRRKSLSGNVPRNAPKAD